MTWPFPPANPNALKTVPHLHKQQTTPSSFFFFFCASVRFCFHKMDCNGEEMLCLRWGSRTVIRREEVRERGIWAWEGLKEMRKTTRWWSSTAQCFAQPGSTGYQWGFGDLQIRHDVYVRACMCLYVRFDLFLLYYDQASTNSCLSVKLLLLTAFLWSCLLPLFCLSCCLSQSNSVFFYLDLPFCALLQP